jgi:mRNA interferase RelE/StbE
MHSIEWTAKARKQFRQIDATQRVMIREAVGTLAAWPNCGNVKALVGRQGYRLRVGRYRVIFTVDTNQKPTIVRVEEVKKRDEHTY